MEDEFGDLSRREILQCLDYLRENVDSLESQESLEATNTAMGFKLSAEIDVFKLNEFLNKK